MNNKNTDQMLEVVMYYFHSEQMKCLIYLLESGIDCIQVRYKDDKEKADQMRHDVVGVLQSAKPTKPNLTPEQWNSIKILKENKDILILPVDKGKCVVTIYTSQNTWTNVISFCMNAKCMKS